MNFYLSIIFLIASIVFVFIPVLNIYTVFTLILACYFGIKQHILNEIDKNNEK